MPRFSSLLSAAVRAALLLTVATAAFSAHAALQTVTYLLPAPPNLPAFGPWMIAQYEGYYKDEGLQMHFITAHGGVDVAKQLGAGNALIGSATGDTSIIARANGIPVKTVALLGSGSQMVLTVRRGGDIKSVADLKGKTISVMSYEDTSYYALLGVLSAAGINKQDVSIEAAGPGGVWQLFAVGHVQAMAAVPDWIPMVEQAGVPTEILPVTGSFRSMPQAIIASDEAIRTQPDMIRKVIRATLRGVQQIIKDPKAAAAIYVKAVPEEKGKEAEVEATFRLYRQYTYGNTSTLGQVDPKREASVQDFYVSEKLVPKRSPLQDLYTNQFVTGH